MLIESLLNNEGQLPKFSPPLQVLFQYVFQVQCGNLVQGVHDVYFQETWHHFVPLPLASRSIICRHDTFPEIFSILLLQI